MYFDYPLEQGLRRIGNTFNIALYREYFDYPLEQGLRLASDLTAAYKYHSILIIH